MFEQIVVFVSESTGSTLGYLGMLLLLGFGMLLVLFPFDATLIIISNLSGKTYSIKSKSVGVRIVVVVLALTKVLLTFLLVMHCYDIFIDWLKG